MNPANAIIFILANEDTRISTSFNLAQGRASSQIPSITRGELRESSDQSDLVKPE